MNTTPKPEARYYDGGFYSLFADPALGEIRKKIYRMIEKDKTVIDIGCGTGALAFSLSDKCKKVVGVDRSPEMIRYANAKKKNGNFANTSFQYADATNLSMFPEKAFDFAALSMVLHEIPAALRIKVLENIARISKKIVIADYIVPVPVNFFGLAARAVELMAGIEHFTGFLSYQKHNGLNGLLVQPGLTVERKTTAKTGVIGIFCVS